MFRIYQINLYSIDSLNCIYNNIIYNICIWHILCSKKVLFDTYLNKNEMWYLGTIRIIIELGSFLLK